MKQVAQESKRDGSAVEVHERDAESLKVTVHLKTVITGVSHNHMAVGGERETLWPVKRIRRRVDVGQKRTASIKHLQEQRG